MKHRDAKTAYANLMELTDGDEAFAVEMFLKFTDSMRTDLDQLDTAFRKNDKEAFASMAHRLAGTMRTMGQVKLPTLLIDMEHLCRNGRWKVITIEYENIHKRLTDLLGILEQARPTTKKVSPVK